VGYHPGTGDVVLQGIDQEGERLGSPETVDRYDVIDGALYIDQEGLLMRVDPITLADDGTFTIAHELPISQLFEGPDGEVVVSIGTEVKAYSRAGVERWSYDPNLGDVSRVWGLGAGRILVEASAGAEVIDITGDHPTSVALDYGFPRVAATFRLGGDDMIIAFDDRGAGTGNVRSDLSLIRVGERSLITVKHIDGYVSPEATVAGDTVYVTEVAFLQDEPRLSTIRALCVPELDQLWELQLSRRAFIVPTLAALVTVSDNGTGDGPVTVAVYGER
jgi:hypothetical protein